MDHCETDGSLKPEINTAPSAIKDYKTIGSVKKTDKDLHLISAYITLHANNFPRLPFLIYKSHVLKRK